MFSSSRFVLGLLLSCACVIASAQVRDAAQNPPQRAANPSVQYSKKRDAWLLHGRIVRGKSSAELRRRAYQAKLKMRERAASAANIHRDSQGALTGAWVPLGPAPLVSDASGNGTQDYRQVTGRVTSIAIDPADPTGNTVYVGGAQGGVWRSTNGAVNTAANVTWTPLTDNAATLSIGAIAILPGNTNSAASVILAGTGEGNNSADSYFGMGILRSVNGGNTWTLISSANNGTLPFTGLGTARMAFGAGNTAVTAMTATSEGGIEGAASAGTMPGLYTSLDAGQTWTHDALLDPGSQATDATSATSVTYNAAAGLFFAAIRYHGFYSSLDGVNWTRLASQPGGAALNTTTCPPVSSSNSFACPVYRGEISMVPGRNEMYAWYIALDANGNTLDQGIWQSTNGGASWTQINDSGIAACGDFAGCGVGQGSYNLELLAVPNGATATDLYAGAINIYKCSINSANPACSNNGFINLTHAYGCDPVAAPAHVHPDQHALAFMLPASGGDAGNALIYFANDGGVYRSLNGYTGLTTGSCSGANQFDDLNQNLGSLTQFVSFSQHPSDANTLLGGAQGNGSPATASATTSAAWISVNGGDGGYNAIDPFAVTNWYVSNPDVPPGGLSILECGSGVNCNSGDFVSVVGSGDLGGDDGAFYFPYLLDAQSQAALLVGTCRVWRGPRLGGAFTLVSPNFDTLDAGTCTGNEVNLVRALAAGGDTDANGSLVIYATTDGPGPSEASSIAAGGSVWVTTDATSGPTAFAQVTQNINPNQFPVSSVAIESSDATGNTAYVTIMGFTGGSGHVWKTTNAGGSWIDFSGTGSSALPDAPVNSCVIDQETGTIYVGTDVGVFASSTSNAAWSEVGPSGGSGGFLPNAVVTALAIFNSSGEKILRASTYGRGIWQLNPAAKPDFQLAISNSPQAVFVGTNASFVGTLTALNGYSGSVMLGCIAGSTAPPSACIPPPGPVIPTAAGTPFSVQAGGAVGDYSFNVQGVGSDANQTTHSVGLALHVVNWTMSVPSPSSVTVPRGDASTPVSFQLIAGGSFNQNVTLACTVNIPSAVCNLTPGTAINLTSATPVIVTASVTIPANASPNNYIVTIQAMTSGASPLTQTFTLGVTMNPNFVLSEAGAFPSVNAGSNATSGAINITAQDGFSSPVNLSCSTASGSCSISPTMVNSFPATATVIVNASTLNAGSYQFSVQGVSSSTTHTMNVPFNVGDYQLSGPASLTVSPGQQATPHLAFTPSTFYNSQINATCDASALPGASCLFGQANPVAVNSGLTTTLVANINVPNDAATGNYTINFHSQDVSGTPSHSWATTLTIAPDFSLVTSTSSQTVLAGQTTGAYNLAIIPVGTSFNNAVTLSCSGLPALTQCLFSPSAPVTPGTSSASVVMTIATTGPTSSQRPRNLMFGFYTAGFALPGFVLVGAASSKKSRRGKFRTLALLSSLLLLFILTSCGGASSGGGGGGQPGTKPGNYTITVNGVAGSLQHTVTVGLNVSD